MLGAMKWVSLIVLIFISQLLFSSITIAPSHAKAGSAPLLATLDVCNVSGSHVSLTPDTPSLHECICNPAPLESVEFREPIKPLFALSGVPLQLEHPPQA
ncbi:MAG TPA: hypothetical protein VFG09_01115 [Thermodesulfovibrionales bacterium]|nr:hypothetical protein [Thermodesulfovibrionales bacterium]